MGLKNVIFSTQNLSGVLRPYSTIPGYRMEYCDRTSLSFPNMGYRLEDGPSQHETRKSKYGDIYPSRHTMDFFDTPLFLVDERLRLLLAVAASPPFGLSSVLYHYVGRYFICFFSLSVF